MSTTTEQVAAQVKAQLGRVAGVGASFADFRFYDEDQAQYLFLHDGNLEANTSRFERGVGVRVL
ncbi:hypothetical protein FJY71_10060, partial [candidate division WOR-3 bacterium]|nr:hypothetical protein [candidate division WOR-3 bacterium]